MINKIRFYIQISVLILTITAGIQFYFYVYHTLAYSSLLVAKPESVEAFLPIAALMGWKYFFLSGKWEVYHPAAMIFLAFAVLISFLLRKSFCSWICPVGAISEWFWQFGKKLKINFIPNFWIDLFLRTIKYLLLLFFIYIIGIMGVYELEGFFETIYYKTVDIKMLYFFIFISKTTIITLLILLIISLLFKNFWCKYLCPYGALLSIFSFFSPSKIHRNIENCIDCKKCTDVCHFNIPVHSKKVINSLDCSACMDCVLVCPSKNTLELKTFKFVWNSFKVAVFIIFFFFIITFFAKITGHFKSQVPEAELKIYIKMNNLKAVKHPSL